MKLEIRNTPLGQFLVPVATPDDDVFDAEAGPPGEEDSLMRNMLRRLAERFAPPPDPARQHLVDTTNDFLDRTEEIIEQMMISRFNEVKTKKNIAIDEDEPVEVTGTMICMEKHTNE